MQHQMAKQFLTNISLTSCAPPALVKEIEIRYTKYSCTSCCEQTKECIVMKPKSGKSWTTIYLPCTTRNMLSKMTCIDDYIKNLAEEMMARLSYVVNNDVQVKLKIAICVVLALKYVSDTIDVAQIDKVCAEIGVCRKNVLINELYVFEKLGYKIPNICL